ncbi:MAG TPA: hypothetical protein VE548_01405 [Nitrososphaeraceae archaeon]|jgi:hypothetical protein|nr:hypothetical protein [Nitrososphaeraceae archaeon]
MRREADHTPRLQTFTLEDLEEDPEERTYWCAICKSELVYLNHTNTIWRCDNCLSYYDTKIQDTPIIDKPGIKLKSYHDLYRQSDEDDLNILFVEGIDIESRDSEENGVQTIRASADKRVQHIRVKGSPTKALSAMNEIDGRT